MENRSIRIFDYFSDLRTIIGLFFLIVSLFLFVAGFLDSDSTKYGFNMNWGAGLFIGGFALGMIGFGLWAVRKG